jgi:hypothetical protein
MIDDLKQHPFDVSLKMGVHLDPVPTTLSIQLSNRPTMDHDGNLPFMGSFASTPEFLTTLFGDFIAHLTQFYLAKRGQIYNSEEATASSDSDDDSDKTHSALSPPPSPVAGIGAEDALFFRSMASIADSLQKCRSASPNKCTSDPEAEIDVEKRESTPLDEMPEEAFKMQTLPLMQLITFALQNNYRFEKHYAMGPEQGVLSFILTPQRTCPPRADWMMYPHPTLTLSSIAEQVLRTLLIKTQAQISGHHKDGMYS